LFKKVYDGVYKKIAEEPSPVKRFLMNRAIEVGLKVNQVKLHGGSVGPFLGWQHRFLDKVVLSKMRATFGGKLRLAVVGGAPTPPPVILFIEALGINLTEGYGLTETSPVLSVTYAYQTHRILGTVGQPLPRTEVRLVMDGKDVAEGEEGELWAAGPQIMQGYWKSPEATEEVIVEEGGKRWFRTGDLATFVNGNHIKITGRSKEQYKLENGKYVAPAPIEQAMSMSKFVAQCVLYGAGHPYNVAAIVPDFEALASELGLDSWYNSESLCKDPKVIAFMETELERVLTEHDIKKYEQPQALLLIAEPFSAANEMLTPKLSIRKPNVIKVYKDQLDALYQQKK
jgi:long-chain acyl-CoA synthetase